jgi:hypothetical protein
MERMVLDRTRHIQQDKTRNLSNPPDEGQKARRPDVAQPGLNGPAFQGEMRAPE